MKKIILICLFLTYTNVLFASTGITVHAFNKRFIIPSNCEFFVKPSATAGETRFNCTFLSPIDPVVIHFRSRKHCDIGILPNLTEGSKTNKSINGVRYIEKEEISSRGHPLIWRAITDDEVCIYAFGFYANNLDTILKGLWVK